jgi:superoxide dismutase, Cu-Zn family
MQMSRLLLTAASVTLAGAVALAQQAQTAKPQGDVAARAHAEIKGKGITGTAEFVERKQNIGSIVEVTITASGLTPGLHGVHLHAVGKCDPDFSAAGGHFDPGPHGHTDPDANHPFHMGDIPNLEVGEDGRGTLKTVTTRVSLSPGPISLFDDDGSAVIIHADPDQGITGAPKSGVSGGARVACGVIVKK